MRRLIIACAGVVFLLLPQKADAQTFRVCHGYDCIFRTKLTLSPADQQRIRALMNGGARSAASERSALRSAVSLFEKRSTAVIGVRDKPKMEFGRSRIKGQMDCVDESTNTDNFIRYLAQKGWLRHHTPQRRTSRGFFIDGRYPHWTAVIRDKSGKDWAVDSWYGAGGEKPDITALEAWKRAR